MLCRGGGCRLFGMIKQIPNILTIARLFGTVIFLAMVYYAPGVAEAGRKTLLLDAAFVIFVVSSLTDMIDGKIARKYNLTSKFGRMIDPLVDKILVVGSFITFAVIGEPKLFDWSDRTLAVIHWGVAAVLVSRELYVTILRHWAESRGINFAATWSGKIKMFAQVFAIGTVVVKMAHVPEATWGSCFTSTVFLVMICFTVASGLLASRRKSLKQQQ